MDMKNFAKTTCGTELFGGKAAKPNVDRKLSCRSVIEKLALEK